MKDWKEDIDKKYGITSSVDPDYRFLKAERIGTLIADIESLLKKEYDKGYKDGCRLTKITYLPAWWNAPEGGSE